MLSALMKTMLEMFGRIDILVPVAGLAKCVPAEDFPTDDLQTMTDVNSVGLSYALSTRGDIQRQKLGKVITVFPVRSFAGHPEFVTS